MKEKKDIKERSYKRQFETSTIGCSRFDFEGQADFVTASRYIGTIDVKWQT